ncbi:hypothetical protein TU94_15740 [Streptomyces cyaneogriseus subsp. noncyanogenus]|uniref:Uncharacterized protein n=1 Tax=Streptomyces cyaneogriseus subsp. noncyanogenus TaxID=477245 RepID=A0A0C5G2D9_9ACTN|nr:hypothetical protein TU94_15740 [Streptomyces cyaneogriseus subsp. noncyanogenus]
MLLVTDPVRDARHGPESGEVLGCRPGTTVFVAGSRRCVDTRGMPVAARSIRQHEPTPALAYPTRVDTSTDGPGSA